MNIQIIRTEGDIAFGIVLLILLVIGVFLHVWANRKDALNEEGGENGKSD